MKGFVPFCFSLCLFVGCGGLAFGCEADAIVLIGLDKNSFKDARGLEFYVGTSRAKQYLDLIALISPQEYSEVVSCIDEDAPIKKEPEKMRKILGGVFSADVVMD